MRARDRDWQLDKNVGGATKRKIIKQGQRAAYQHKVDWNFKIYYKRVQWIVMAFAVEVFSYLKNSKPGQKAWLLYRDVKALLGWKLFFSNLVSVKEVYAKCVGLYKVEISQKINLNPELCGLMILFQKNQDWKSDFSCI